MDCSLPGFSVHGILQARTHWSGLPFPSPMHESEVAQSCLTLSDPMDCSLPGSPIHGIFRATVLEWGAIAFSNWHSQETLTTELEFLTETWQNGGWHLRLRNWARWRFRASFFSFEFLPITLKMLLFNISTWFPWVSFGQPSFEGLDPD